MQFFRIFAKAFNFSGNIWIGLNDIETEGKWKWITGTTKKMIGKPETVFWYEGHSDSDRGNCAHIYLANSHTYTSPCSISHDVVCEKSVWNVTYTWRRFVVFDFNSSSFVFELHCYEGTNFQTNFLVWPTIAITKKMFN